MTASKRGPRPTNLGECHQRCVVCCSHGLPMAVSTPARMENGQGCGPEFALLVGQRHLEACPGSTAPTGAYLWADVRNRNHPCLLSSRRWLVARLTAGQHFMSKVCRTDVWGETGGGGGCYWFTCGRTGCTRVSARERGRRCTDEPTCHVAGVPAASRFCWWTTTARRAAECRKSTRYRGASGGLR